MQTFQQYSFLTQIFRIAKIACVLIALAMSTACASFSSFFKQTASPIPIETIESIAGAVSNTRAYEFSNRLYISGYIQKSFGRHIPYGAHVDVQLIDNEGSVILEKQEKIDPSHPKSIGKNSNHISYAASFPLGETRQVAKIVVRYHLNGHNS